MNTRLSCDASYASCVTAVLTASLLDLQTTCHLTQLRLRSRELANRLQEGGVVLRGSQNQS